MYHYAQLKIWLTRLETYIFCSILQCHNIVNSKTLLLHFFELCPRNKILRCRQTGGYILPDSKIINCKQTKLLFLIKLSWLVFKRKGLKIYKFNSKTKQTQKQMHYTKLFYYSESVSKVVLFQNFNFSLLSVYGLVHGQNLLYKARTRKSISWLLIGKWILYRWRPSKIEHRTFRFHFTICLDIRWFYVLYRNVPIDFFYVSSLT